jgi:signal transduction histidine kinase
MNLSVRTKVFLLFAGAALLTVAPVLFLVAQAVETRVYERATGELVNARDRMRTYWSLRDDALQANARRVAREPIVADLLLSGDTAKLRRVLRDEVDGGMIVVASDSAGLPLVGPALDSALVAGGTQPGTIVTFAQGGGSPIRLAVAPVLWTDTTHVLPDSLAGDSLASAGGARASPDSSRVRLLGLVGVGSTLGRGTLEVIRKVADGPVALVSGDSVLAATFPDSVTTRLARLGLAGALAHDEVIWQSRVEGLPFLYAVNAFPTQGRPTGIVTFRSVAEELKIAKGLKESVVWIGVAALVLSLGLALVVSRIVARPAQTLAAAAADLARGDFGAPLPTASSDEMGQLTRAFGVMRAAIAERAARLRSAQAELIHREKLAAMGRLVAQLSHEINNPIYNIQNCLEVLDRRGRKNDPNREFLELAREELDRMASLTRQLLDQSRPLADAAHPLNLSQVLQRVVTLVRADLESHRIRTELQLEPDLPLVVAHPDAIQQVLANLVDNAIDAMPGGGTLRLRTRSAPDSVEVAVEDTGAGIPAEHLSRIFEAFFTTKPEVSGIGLGLFVSDGIIRGHRGRLFVESRVGQGSRFTVRLPRETLDATPASEGAPERDAPAAVGPTSTSRARS